MGTLYSQVLYSVFSNMIFLAKYVVIKCNFSDSLHMTEGYSRSDCYKFVNDFMYTDTTICLRETDMDWNITWPTTDSGQTVRQKCPGGAESIGMYSFILYS